MVTRGVVVVTRGVVAVIGVEVTDVEGDETVLPRLVVPPRP